MEVITCASADTHRTFEKSKYQLIHRDCLQITLLLRMSLDSTGSLPGYPKLYYTITSISNVRYLKDQNWCYIAREHQYRIVRYFKVHSKY